jgi:TRAP-type mannitol/chloroaromatic compound transport system permease small subunit
MPVISALMKFVRLVDALNRGVGRAVGWMTLGTVVVCATVVLLRYVFKTGFVWMQELYVWIHACVFMLGAGYALLLDKHVRVDIWLAKQSVRVRAWVEIGGCLVFLVPWIGVLAWATVPYVARSWTILETSTQSGGMPGVFLLKAVILVFCVLFGLQGLARATRAVLLLMGHEMPPARA